MTGEAMQATVFARDRLAAGMAMTGPAMIQEDGTTTIVPPGFTAHVGAAGEIVIEEDKT
jgi:N-methylhydantoinase A